MRWLKGVLQVFSDRRPLPPSLPPSSVHDLEGIYQEINDQYFAGTLTLSIAWFGYKKRSRRICRKVLGYYDERGKRIRIHRSLDSPFFPSFFVAYVIYHEMLHSVERPKMLAGRRSIHHKDFRLKEKQFHAYDAAKAWEKENLHKILNGR